MIKTVIRDPRWDPLPATRDSLVRWFAIRWFAGSRFKDSIRGFKD
jgi:hypothetical protein